MSKEISTKQLSIWHLLQKKKKQSNLLTKIKEKCPVISTNTTTSVKKFSERKNSLRRWPSSRLALD